MLPPVKPIEKATESQKDAYWKILDELQGWLIDFIWICYPDRFQSWLHGPEAWDTYDQKRPQLIARTHEALSNLRQEVPDAYPLFSSIVDAFLPLETAMYEFVAANRTDREALASRFDEFLDAHSNINDRLGIVIDTSDQYIRD